MDKLRGLVDLARCTPSSKNLQPLKYILCCDPERNATVFENLAWAGYLKDWPGPAEGERPSAYIIMLGDTQIGKSFDVDCGIAAQTILLGARVDGLGGCIIRSIKRSELARALSIAPQYEILIVIALGKPNEEIVLESVGETGDIKYWRDRDDVHHVPKRSLDEIIIG
jgi:nitroreductase